MSSTHNAFSLEGKHILVTGASSGLGQEIALSCARRGAKVVITARDADRLQATFDQLPGDGHLQILAEQTRAEERGRLVQAAPPLDGVVHCAGKQMLSPIRLLKPCADDTNV